MIIPTRNSSATLGACLDAVVSQTYPSIELLIVDSHSTDSTPEVAEKYGANIISTEWKLLGARYLGFKESRGALILILDSDQILYPDTIERLVQAIQDFDMLCLEEETYEANGIIENLFDADRKLTNSMSHLHLDPLEGVMLARFYRRAILEAAFNNIPIEKLHDVVAHDHAIIYYEAYHSSRRVSILPKAVQHKEPSSIIELWRKNYRYGKTTKELLNNGFYETLLRKKTRFRKGLSLNSKSIQSILLLVLKGIPYFIGLKFGR